MNAKANLCTYVYILWSIASKFNRDLILGLFLQNSRCGSVLFCCNSWKFSQCKLHRTITGKAIELMHFSEFFHHRFWCNAIAHFPTRDVEWFSEGGNHDAAMLEFGSWMYRNMTLFKSDVFIDFIRQQDDLGIFLQEVFQCLKIWFGPDFPCGIVWIVDNYYFGFGRKRFSDAIPIGRVIIIQIYSNR